MKHKKGLLILSIIFVFIASVIILLLKFNNNGIHFKKEWNLSYGMKITKDMYKDDKRNFVDGHYGFSSIDTTKDGYIMVGTAGTSSFDEHGIIEFYDKNGKIKWKRQYKDETNEISGFKKVLSVNTGFIVIGYIKNNEIILKYDLNGNLVWNKEYDSLSYDLNDIIALNDKYYILGNKIEFIDSTDENSKKTKYTGIAIEFDSDGKEFLLNEYNKYTKFLSAEKVGKKIIVNTIIGYVNIESETYYTTNDGIVLLSFDGSNFNQIIEYTEVANDENAIPWLSYDDSGTLSYAYVGSYEKFTYLKGIYYIIDSTTPGKILAINEKGEKQFSITPIEGENLNNYYFTDITSDEQNIYVNGYRENDHEFANSAIITFDVKGNYKIVNLDEQNYSTILYKNKSLLFVGVENSFAKYSIK